MISSGLLSSGVIGLLMLTRAWGQVHEPDRNPPFAPGPGDAVRMAEAPFLLGVTGSPSQEWTFHKTADGNHPSGAEQQMVWLMNRARGNPGIEGIWLAHLRQSNVQVGMDYFAVQRQVLMDEFSVRSVVPPAAFDNRLYNAASNHSAYLISIDGQNHSNQFARITAAGFNFSSARGSVYSYAEDSVVGHAVLNVDWGGNDGTGMQTGRGHREGVMGIYPSVGISCLADNNPTNAVGPLVTTINYCNPVTSYSNHYDRFILGTVWNDLNTNSLYDPGEGMGSVTVMPDKGTFFAVTGSAGGYALPAVPDSYVVTFFGGGLPSNVVKAVTLGTTSVLVDCPVHSNTNQAQAALTVGANWALTYTLNGQRKGYAYRLSISTNLISGIWDWAGVLPSGYAATLTYNAQLIDTNVSQRFMTLQGWRY